jgi:hypothetical protein
MAQRATESNLQGHKMKYKGHEYEIDFCNPKEYTSEGKGLFRIDMAMTTGGAYYKTYAEAEEKAKSIIDKFVIEIPQTREEWLSAMTECMVWTGYEDCHLDEDMVWSLLQKAAKHLKIKGDKS